MVMPDFFANSINRRELGPSKIGSANCASVASGKPTQRPSHIPNSKPSSCRHSYHKVLAHRKHPLRGRRRDGASHFRATALRCRFQPSSSGKAQNLKFKIQN
jgi:hypothetical protein